MVNVRYEDLTPEEKEMGYGRALVARNKKARGFQPGNKHAKGHPYQKKAGELRASLFEEATKEDMRLAIRALIEKAKKGNIQACRELFDRLLGKPEAFDLLARLEELEALLDRATGAYPN